MGGPYGGGGAMGRVSEAGMLEKARIEHSGLNAPPELVTPQGGQPFIVCVEALGRHLEEVHANLEALEVRMAGLLSVPPPKGQEPAVDSPPPGNSDAVRLLWDLQARAAHAARKVMSLVERTEV